MFKEFIICVVIVIVTIWGSNITQDYTNKTIEEISNSLLLLREKLVQGNIENEKLREDVDEIQKVWNKKHEKLALYIEHTELEKIDTEIISIKSHIETKEYGDSINGLDKSVFLLKHVADRYAFSLENIF